MDWGILQGLGQGLQTVGKMKLEEDEETRRTKLAEKLQRDREERAKLAFDPQQTTVEQGEGGAWFQVKRNKNGDVMGRDLAPKNEIDKITREAAIEGLTIESLQAQIAASKATTEGKKLEMDWGKEDRVLLTPEQRRAAALVDAKLRPSADTKYSTDHRTILSASGSTAEKASASPAEYAEAFVKDSPEVKAQWVDSGKMTETQLTAAVKAALIRFAQVGKQPSAEDINGYIAGYFQDSPDKFGKPKTATAQTVSTDLRNK